MKPNEAVVFSDTETVDVERRPRPEPERDEVLIETRRTMVSTGTELTVLSGEFDVGEEWQAYSEFPFVPGYNNVGRVVEVGDDVDDDLVGERVATWREHASYDTSELDSCRFVPEGVSDEEASFFALAEVAMNGVRQSGLEWGDAAVVFGLGVVGQLAVRIAHFAGARPVVAFEPADERRSYAPDLPGVVTADPTDADPAAVVRDANGGDLADVVFEVTGAPDVIPEEFDALREKGTLVLLSSPRGSTQFDFHDFCNAHSYDIVGTHVMSHPERPTVENLWTRKRHAHLFFDLVAEGTIDVASLVTRSVPYERAPETYADLLDDRSAELGVVFEW